VLTALLFKQVARRASAQWLGTSQLPLGISQLVFVDGRIHNLFRGWREVEPQPRQCKATWKSEFKLPWREAGPLHHHDDEVDSDQ